MRGSWGGEGVKRGWGGRVEEGRGKEGIEGRGPGLRWKGRREREREKKERDTDTDAQTDKTNKYINK